MFYKKKNIKILYVYIYVRKNKFILIMVMWCLCYVLMLFEMLFCILSIGNVVSEFYEFFKKFSYIIFKKII